MGMIFYKCLCDTMKCKNFKKVSKGLGVECNVDLNKVVVVAQIRIKRILLIAECEAIVDV